jgi:hypothetical protein
VIRELIDRHLSDRADDFIKYYNNEYFTDFQKAEELSRNRTDGKNILAAVGEAISDYENSKLFSAVGEPSFSSLMMLLDLMNQVLFNGVLGL